MVVYRIEYLKWLTQLGNLNLETRFLTFVTKILRKKVVALPHFIYVTFYMCHIMVQKDFRNLS